MRDRRSVTEDELNAKAFLAAHDISSSEMCYKSGIAEWRYASDITNENERLKVSYGLFYVFSPLFVIYKFKYS